MPTKVHLPSTENHGSHCMPQSLARAALAAPGDVGRRVDGSAQVRRGGGEGRLSCFLHTAANGHQLGCVGSRVLSFV